MNRETRVGLMFALSIVIFGTALYYLGNLKEMVSYKIRFDKVIGLEQDSPVQFRGVPIGRVSKIVLSDEVSPTSSQVPIIVTISVHNSVSEHIRKSTVADIRSVGVLGAKSILLITEDYSAEVLEPGGLITPAPKSLDVDKLLEQGEDLVSDATSITKDLRNILSQMANEEGPFQTLINDDEMARDMKQVIANALSYMEQERNLMTLILKDEEFANRVESRIDESLGNVSALTTQLREANGLLPMLLSDEAFKIELTGKLNSLLDNANDYVTTLKDGRGLAYKLTQDEAYSERLTANLEKASFHLASILEKIDEGDGTASMVINDPSLYEGLYEVVYGLQHSGITKWYIQRKQRKGARLREKEEAQKP